MIQRVQTLYLLLASVAMILFYIFPIAEFVTDIFTYAFYNCHITHPENLEPPIALMPLATLPFLSSLLSLFSIFLFKKRKLQIRINKVNMLLVITTVAVGVLYFMKIKNLLNGDITYGYASVFPVITFILLLMANSAIKKDEALVRAADRIR